MVPVGGKSLKGYCLIQLVSEDKENIPHDRSLCAFYSVGCVWGVGHHFESADNA